MNCKIKGHLTYQPQQISKSIISENFGDNYVYNSVRTFKNKVKNSQEAHEAIRPSDPSIKPSELPAPLEQDLKKLYDLIWRRSLSTQASQSISKIITIKIIDKSNKECARGLCSFSSDEVKKILGHHSKEIEKILGYIAKSEVVHKDDMVEI